MRHVKRRYYINFTWRLLQLFVVMHVKYYTCEEYNEVCCVYTPKRHILLSNTAAWSVL